MCTSVSAGPRGRVGSATRREERTPLLPAIETFRAPTQTRTRIAFILGWIYRDDPTPAAVLPGQCVANTCPMARDGPAL